MIEDEGSARAFCAARADGAGLARLELLAALLAEENDRQNLVSAASLGVIWHRHFADSLQLLDFVSRETSPWLDLGSGAGFPGLAVSAVRPELEVILVESRRKRAEWLSRAVATLGLPRCRVACARLEAFETLPAGVITARAFAPLERLVALAARFSTRDTVWLLPKGRSAAQELEMQSAAVRAMFHVERSATENEGGILIGKGAPPVR